MSRLIVVSNRVNPPADPGLGSTGGLAMALAAALREYSGVWFGWSGETTEHFTGQIRMQRVGGVTIALVDLEEQDRLEYYNGYANKTLWPLFHYRTDLTSYERSFDEGYARVNRRFAETLVPLLEPDDLIWVHDYHLIPMARELRKLGVKNRIGFFLHIPWPARRLLTTLPKHRALVETLFDYDVIGFQTEDNREAFEDYVIHEAHGSVAGPGRLTAFDHTVQVDSFPIGIDAQGFIEAAKSDEATQQFDRMQTSLAGRRMVLGVDRLDYSKGLEERFLAYEQFLIDHPEQQEDVFLLQIATPSRDEVEAYQEIRHRLDGVAGRINGEFATVDWVPIRYVNRGYRRDQLAGIYRAADVALVTPLRDGMNLVAKEFVAAQDPEDPGVLILSRFAGAADQMTDAVLVNPFSREDMSDAIRRALAMPLTKRRMRWERLLEGVKRDDVNAWRDRFVAALRGPPPEAANGDKPEDGHQAVA
ncbi:trehalose 6-phosphate synthase [Caulobacter ginsengisoli]|uniref:Trehalose-6-phosphate synthase n=1 Tax=Caulobacter ginsengisoli TaxID=400775 RepID=A0ABU0IUP0_9CAUL|nr:alpha,alpha-trehalose-phosphate synthase (UDP-forming) [Caulobacter ginsengisoli]MDQ0465725.1 trehalose 6-phosphate synthase [Caulobacter ginsengisoli]